MISEDKALELLRNARKKLHKEAVGSPNAYNLMGYISALEIVTTE